MKEKLNHNFHELNLWQMIFYLLFIRPFWDKEKRFFFEGSFGLPGQMYYAERQLIHETILKYKPNHCLEIGTYTGGGSTFFIATAFAKLGRGKLITSEVSDYYYKKAKNYYQKKLPRLNRYVEFKFGDDFNLFLPELERAGQVDCFFLDGAENGEETKNQYLEFLPYCRSGTIMIAHDWQTEKTATIRPMIVNDNRWRLITELTPPASVGLTIWQYQEPSAPTTNA